MERLCAACLFLTASLLCIQTVNTQTPPKAPTPTPGPASPYGPDGGVKSLSLMSLLGGAGGLNLKKLIKLQMLMKLMNQNKAPAPPSGPRKGNMFNNLLKTRTLCETGGEAPGGEGLGLIMGGCKLNPFMCLQLSMERYNIPTALKCSPMGLCCFKGIGDKIMTNMLVN